MKITRRGWRRSDCRVDVNQLVAEQRSQATALTQLKDQRSQRDWANATELINRVRSQLA
jgi:hypothetical protein